MDYVWSPSSVVEIAGRTGVSLECLEQECSLEVLHGVSHLCEPWEGMGKGLNLSEREISIIGFKHRNDNEELRVALLERWKELLDYNATYWKLMEAFLFSGIVRGAQEVCRLLKTNGDQKSALEMEGVIHFRFHSVTGKNIALSSDGLEARRKRVGDGADAVVMGAKPLIGSAKLEVEVLSISNMHQGMGSIQIGVMQCKSGTEFEQSDIPCHAEFGNSYCVLWKSFIWNSLGDRMTTCKYGSLNLYNVNQGDRVGMGITNEGDLLFFLNGKSHGVGVWNVCREGFDLYPVVDVANACAAVRITTAVMSAESLQEACVQVIASCLDSLKSIDQLPIPEKLKRRVKEYVSPRLSTLPAPKSPFSSKPPVPDSKPQKNDQRFSGWRGKGILRRPYFS